jgi:hypothetical protein
MQETPYTRTGSPHQPKYPTTVRAAGIIWIVIGASMIAGASFVLLLMLGIAADTDSANKGISLVGKLVGALFQCVVGGFFLYEGIESCRGTISTPVGIAVGSISFAAILVAVAVVQPLPHQGFGSALMFIPVAGLLTAGILALKGRTQYDAWWKAQRGHRAQKRKGSEAN